MPSTRRSRTIAAPLQLLWEVVEDPHHLPRWWPRVERIEDVDGDAAYDASRDHFDGLRLDAVHAYRWPD